MINLQLVDSLDGGYFVFQRNNYILDEGIYTELYAALFSMSTATWWADGAFNTNTYNVTSRTEITLKNLASTSTADLNLVKKAVEDDLKRFTDKNSNISVKDVLIIAYQNKAIRILIDLEGFNDSFDFIFSKTQQSLTNIKPLLAV
jgi:hypothetical protein